MPCDVFSAVSLNGSSRLRRCAYLDPRVPRVPRPPVSSETTNKDRSWSEYEPDKDPDASCEDGTQHVSKDRKSVV